MGPRRKAGVRGLRPEVQQDFRASVYDREGNAREFSATTLGRLLLTLAEQFRMGAVRAELFHAGRGDVAGIGAIDLTKGEDL